MSWDWLDDMEDIKLEVNALRKADIDGITQQIDMAKTGIQSATNRDQINNAKNNSKFIIDNAGKYKSTKMYADTYSNYADNKLNDYNMYETALMKADNYLSQNEFLDREKEWLDINNLSKNRGYDSMMDFLKDEMDVVTGYLMDTTDGEGKLKNYNWNKGNKGNDKFIVSKLLKYQNQLSMAMNAAVLDGFISPEEALYAYQADKTDWDAFKKAQVGEAEDLIKNGKNKMFRIDELINKAEGSRGFANALNMMTLGEMDDMNINYTTDANGQLSGSTETAETFLGKLNTHKNIYRSDYNAGLRKYQSYMGIGYGKMMGEPPDTTDLGDYADNLFLDVDNDGTPDLIQAPLSETKEDKDKPSVKSNVSVEEYEVKEIKEKKLSRNEKREKEAPKVRGIGTEIFSTGSTERAQRFNVHPSLQEEVNERQPYGFGYGQNPGDLQFTQKIMDKSNRLQEKERILDGADKAAPAMNEFLIGNLNMNQAMTKGKYSDSTKTEIVGQASRKKLKVFQIKFQKANKKGMSIEEFISENKEEYYEMVKILKYGDYWWKNAKKIGKSQHYMNLYDSIYETKKPSNYYNFK